MHIVATAGHVDHGKSTLLRTLTGMEPDRWDEERRRGLTIDLGFVWTDLEAPAGSVTVAFVDVPGHERFLANMLAGVGAAPAALLVVAADDGWSPQSQEHLDVLQLLDVPILLAAVTKLDVAGPERAAEVAADVRARLASVGRAATPVLVVDGRSDDDVAGLAATLAAALADRPAVPVGEHGRLWVDRSFTVTGSGTVVTGTLHHGAVAVGDTVRLSPSGRTARVRGLQCLGEPVRTAGPGSRVAMNLAGVEREQIARGDAVLTGPPPSWPVTDRFDAIVSVLGGQEVGERGAWLLHAGTAVVEAAIHPVLGDPLTSDGYVRIELRQRLPLRCGDRFVLRDAGRRRVVAGGAVLVPWAGQRLRGTDARLRRADVLDRVAGATGPELAAALVAADVDRSAGEILVAAGQPPDTEVPGVIRLGDRWVLPERLAAWSGTVTERLRDAGASGLERAAVLTTVADAGCPSSLAAEVIDHLVAAGGAVAIGPRLLHAEHADDHRRRASGRRDAFLERLRSDPWSPPALADLLRDTGISHAELQTLVDGGHVVLQGELAFADEALADAVERLVMLAEGNGPFTAAQAKEALGTSRRYAIPLLEILDARGVTAFDGNLRRLRRSTWHVQPG